MVGSKTFERHAKAIEAQAVTKTNVIGIRKAFNASAKGWPLRGITADEIDRLMVMVWEHKPRIAGELHETGLELLRSSRYRKRLEPVASIIADLDHFRLVDFEWIDNRHCVPVYRALDCRGRGFNFRNVPWQSGGNGPELLPEANGLVWAGSAAG